MRKQVKNHASKSAFVQVLRSNRGKTATFYMTYENNREWNAKIFKGIIESAGLDSVVISDPATGMRYLLLTRNVDYVTFDVPISTKIRKRKITKREACCLQQLASLLLFSQLESFFNFPQHPKHMCYWCRSLNSSFRQLHGNPFIILCPVQLSFHSEQLNRLQQAFIRNKDRL